MIRRDFIKMLSIVPAGFAFFRGSNPSTSVAAQPKTSQRQWLSGSSRTGCARRPAAELLPH